MLNRRDRVRVVVNGSIEGVIFADSGFPDFSNHFIINLGGILLSNGIEYHQSKHITVRLFHRNGDQLSIDGELLSTTAEQSIIKFNPLTHRQRQTLTKMLTFQQAYLCADD